MDINTAVGSGLGIIDKINALADYKNSSLLDEKEKIVLEYADAITYSNKDVNEKLFQSLTQYFDDDSLVELTAIICWENFSSKFNRAFRVPSQGFCEKK